MIETFNPGYWLKAGQRSFKKKSYHVNLIIIFLWDNTLLHTSVFNLYSDPGGKFLLVTT